MAVHGRQVAAVLAFLQILSYVNAQSTSGVTLNILPNGDNQIKPVGSKVLLTCEPSNADASLVTDIQWLDPEGRVIEPLSSAQGNTKPPMYTEVHTNKRLLFFNSLQEDQAGTYTCKASYANTKYLTRNVTIETIVGITWEDAPVNQYPILGEDFAIKCKVRSQPSPLVDWLYNDELIATNDHYIIETHALKLINAQESDDGIYICRVSVTDTGEVDERAIRIEVHTRPQIQDPVSTVEIIEGENADIKCKAIGKPPPKFTWIKLLTQEDLAKTGRFGVDEDTGILTITNANRDDAGKYQCKAVNAVGEASTDIDVTVIVKPKIMEFINVTSVVGKNAEMVCKAFGRPPPQVYFRKQTVDKPFTMGPQLSDSRIILNNAEDDLTGETTAVLSFNNLSRSDDGLYECIAKNKGGDAYKNGHLTVEFPPSFASMKNLKFWSWEERPVNLTCIAESIPNATVRWQKNGEDIKNDPWIKQLGNGPVSTLTIVPRDIRYYADYKCIASNIHGTKDYHIELREARKPEPVRQSRIKEITATTVTFDLVEPIAQEGLPIKTITVQYKPSVNTWAVAVNKTWAAGSPYILEGLTPETLYDFRFKGGNDVGNGNWGAQLHESTPQRSSPGRPEVITKLAQGSDYEISHFGTQFNLRWNIPIDNGEPINMYTIRYCPMTRDRGNWQITETSCVHKEVKSGSKSNYWLKDLEPDTFYRAEVKAHNSIGYSEPGTIQFRTAGDQNKVVEHEGPLISSASIIGIVIAALFILIIVIDVICCCANKTGIIFYVCERSRRKPIDEDDAKLGREEKEPLREEKKITPIIDSGLRRETSVNFNGKTSVSKTGFVGKDSAV